MEIGIACQPDHMQEGLRNILAVLLLLSLPIFGGG